MVCQQQFRGIEGELRVAPVCQFGDCVEALHKYVAVVPVARDESGTQSAGCYRAPHRIAASPLLKLGHGSVTS